jgi:phosphatidylinositol kinase/protein kinase (PI-3  family)
VFSSAFIASAACWLRRQHIVKNYLNLYLRDDLVSWNVTLQPIGNDSALDELEKQLRPSVSSNTSQILARVQSLMPSSPSPADVRIQIFIFIFFAESFWLQMNKTPLSINAKIQRLIESAASIDNLSSMPPTWHPWF